MPLVSVVVLCYKAAENVPPFVAKVEAALGEITQDYEIVLVGNYNRGEEGVDKTPEYVRAEAARDARITAVAREKEGMMGWDARTGLDAAKGEVIMLIDGDNQMPPRDIASVYNLLVSDNLDLAMTYRDHRGDGFLRRANSKIYNLVFTLLFPGLPVRDVNSKPKAMTRAFYDKLELTADGWCLDADIMVQARRRKARLGQIPTVFFRSRDRKSFVRADAIWEFVKTLLGYRVREFFVKKP